jgi:hypothetical protein
MWSFYQDRLGTDIGKALKKETKARHTQDKRNKQITRRHIYIGIYTYGGIEESKIGRERAFIDKLKGGRESVGCRTASHGSFSMQLGKS